jgi:hypothetical protein
MIAEIVEFMHSIEPSGYATENIRPVVGLHILIKFDEEGKLPRDAEGKPKRENFHTVVVPKKGVAHEDWDIVSRYEQLSGLTSKKYLDMEKIVGTKKMQIHSSSPYSIWFKKEAISEAAKRINVYMNAYRQLGDFESGEMQYIEQIETYVSTSLLLDIQNCQPFDGLKKDEYIKVYFSYVPQSYWQAAQARYLNSKLFLYDDYTKQSERGKTVGLSGFLNTFGDKKTFLKHLTSSVEINNLISFEDARQLFLFERLLKAKTSDDRKKLPNPLPLFIDKSELNGSLIAVYSASKGSLSTNEILREAFAKGYTIDSGNYMLLNWSNTGDGLKIYDMDIIAAFRFMFDEPMRVQKFFNSGEERSLKDVLAFETDIVQKIFNRQN